MPIARYFVERLTAHSDVWTVKFDDEEHGPYKSQFEAVLITSAKRELQRLTLQSAVTAPAVA